MDFIKVKYKEGFFLKNQKIEKSKNNKKFFFILFVVVVVIILIYFFMHKILFINNAIKVLIEVDVSKSFFDGGGPVQLAKALRDVLPYETNKCKFIASKSMTPNNAKNKTNYFYLPFFLFKLNLMYIRNDIINGKLTSISKKKAKVIMYLSLVFNSV